MRTFVLTDDEMYMKLCAVADCADPKAILECQNVETFKVFNPVHKTFMQHGCLGLGFPLKGSVVFSHKWYI